MLYQNDYEKSKLLLQLLDTNYLEEKTGINKTSLSKFKTRLNVAWNTISKIINIEKREGVSLQFFLSSDIETMKLIIDYSEDSTQWVNEMILDVKTKEELMEFGYILKHFKIDTPVINKIESFNISKIKNSRVATSSIKGGFVEKVYSAFFNKDKLRESFKVERSLKMEELIPSSNMENIDFDEDYDIGLGFKNASLEVQEALIAKNLISQEKSFKKYRTSLVEDNPHLDSSDYDVFEESEEYQKLSMIVVTKRYIKPSLLKEMLNFGFQERERVLVYRFEV